MWLSVTLNRINKMWLLLNRCGSRSCSSLGESRFEGFRRTIARGRTSAARTDRADSVCPSADPPLAIASALGPPRSLQRPLHSHQSMHQSCCSNLRVVCRAVGTFRYVMNRTGGFDNSFDGLGAENECMGPQSGCGLCVRRGCSRSSDACAILLHSNHLFSDRGIFLQT